MIQTLKRNWLALKLTWGIWGILNPVLKSLKHSHLYNVWAKKLQIVIFHDTEEWSKIWRKTDLWFEKWHEKFGNFSPEYLKLSRLGLWWDPLVQSRKWISLTYTEKLCVMKMKTDAKFEEELSCHFKIDRRDLTNFDLSTQKSKKFAL